MFDEVFEETLLNSLLKAGLISQEEHSKALELLQKEYLSNNTNK